jgi:hypothetical protein
VTPSCLGGFTSSYKSNKCFMNDWQNLTIAQGLVCSILISSNSKPPNPTLKFHTNHSLPEREGWEGLSEGLEYSL